MFKSVWLILFAGWAQAGGTGVTVDLIDPVSGSTEGGYSISISVSGTFDALSLTQVLMGGADCPIISASNTEITCTVPAGTGNVPVLIYSNSPQNLGGSTNIFSYKPPVINSFTPTTLNQIGGEDLTITGLDFGNSGASVLIGGKRCTAVMHLSNTELSCTTPAGQGQDLVLNVIQDTGAFSNDQLISYEVCQPGNFNDNGTCVPCTVGRYQDQAGQNSCKVCEPGTFSAMPGATSCDLCAVGTFAAIAGAVQCEACSPGKFQSEAGQAECLSCLPGTVNPISGAASCSSCPAGTIADSSGLTNCSLCAAGEFQDQAGQAACQLCPAGSISSVTGSTACLDCNAGFIAAAPGQQSCTACNEGTFQNLEGQASCKSCSPGTVASNTGSAACTLCTAGTYQNDIGQNTCFTCEPGSFAPFSGSNACSLCPAGSFQDQFGASNCLSCPDSELQPAPGQTSCLGPGQCDALYGVFFSEFEAGLEPVGDL
jgi:hypothetical protein